MSSKILPSMSICICTFNRSKSLRRTLDSLAYQRDIKAGSFEVIVVDNNCSDDTRELVDDFRNRLPIRRVTESRQGLAYARNKAVLEFQGDVLLFTDDDVRLAENWLAAYQNAICRFSEADYFGGRILPDWGTKKPHWIRDKPLPLIAGVLVWFDCGTDSRLILTDEQLPWGASFAIKRGLFDKIGMFRVDLGIGAMGLGRDEETEFLRRARGAGAQGVYVGEALCFHAYDPSRLTVSALYRHGISRGRSHNVITARSHRGSYPAAAWFVLRGLYQAIRGHGDRFRQCMINAGIEVGTRPGSLPNK
jgi:glycosyltransferase involved in cell wall biosynthesis